MGSRVKKEQSHVRFFVFFALLSAMIFVRYGLQINIPRALALVPILTIAILGNQTEIIAICMCLIPLHESLDFYYALVLTVIIYVLKYYNRIKLNESFLLLILIIMWELLHCFDGFSPVTFITSIAPMVALTIFLCSDFSELDYAFVVRAVAFAAIVVCVTMLVQVAWISRFNIAATLANLRRLGALDEASRDRLQFSGGMVQTNSLGVICVMITACLLQLRAGAQNRKSDIFVILALLIFGTLTASRTFLACLALMVMLLLLGQKGVLKKIQYFGIAALAGGLIVLLFAVFFPDQLEYYVSRFFETDITTGRDDLMIAYHGFIFENWNILFFGVGLQNYGDKMVNHYRVANNVPHNSIQEIITAWGMPGLLMIILFILSIVYQASRRKNQWKLVNYIPLIIILFKSIAGQLLTSYYSMLALGFAYLNLIQDSNEDIALRK